MFRSFFFFRSNGLWIYVAKLVVILVRLTLKGRIENVKLFFKFSGHVVERNESLGKEICVSQDRFTSFAIDISLEALMMFIYRGYIFI